MSPRRYAVRRLNPFRGITRVVEVTDARAASTDGVNWELQVLTERPVGWGSLNLGRTETLYYRYGVWSEEEGVARYPVHPALERLRLHRSAERLVEALSAAPADRCDETTDRFECWQLDAADRRPLALLAAVTTAESIPAHVASRWHAAPGDAESLAGFGRERAEALERMVARRAGQISWFERKSDGSGQKVGANGTASLPADAFPELTITQTWPEPDAAAAVAEYIGWLAPRLLMLPLVEATRARLERVAATQPDEVAHFFHLYPAVRDSVLMNSLRVQARLNQSA
jgi:hypothetical protein